MVEVFRWPDYAPECFDNELTEEMKIYHIGPAHPLRGGIANFNETLANACHKQGHESELISYSLQYPNFLFPGKTQFTADGYSGSSPIRTLINSINPVSWVKTGLLIKNEAPDAVVIHLWMPFFCPALGTIARLAKRNKKTKIIVLCHNVIPHEKKPGDALLSKYFLSIADGYIAMSKSVLDDLSHFTPSVNKLFIPHPIYDIFGNAVEKATAKRELSLDLDKKYILFFGMVRKYKGLDLLIDAFAKLYKTQKDTRLLVAGEFYGNTDGYLTQIRDLGIEDAVIIRNEFIATDQVKYYFSASDIVAQTYKTATQSGVTQIAYHFQKPMLVTNVGGLAEIVPPSVGFVTDVSADAVAEKLALFFSDNMEEQMSLATVAEKKRFSWDSMVAGIEQLVENR